MESLPGAGGGFGLKPAHPDGGDAARLVRGSALLLVARVVAQAAEFGLQLFFVRYLAKSDYGALAYALSIIMLLRAVALFEMPVTLARFLPIYREQRLKGELLGSVVMSVGIVAGLGLLIALALDAGLVLFDLQPTSDRDALVVLSILVLVVPLEALDILLTSLFATFASPRAIFIRQAIVGPGLKAALAVAVAATQAGLVSVALGYAVVDLLCLVIYGALFVVLLKREAAHATLQRGRLSFPVRTTLGFAAPLLASTLVWILMESSDAILLGYFHSTEEVAAFRAVLLVAALNQGVSFTFALLYTPMLARLYAQRAADEMRDFYWRSTLWVTVLSFPVFLLTFSFASATTAGVVGERYADSAPIMALLAFGYFFHCSLGFNGLTLRVFGKLRYTVAVDVGAAVVNVLVNLLLIPRWGAVGAAVGTSSTMVIHNLLKQYGLWRYTGVGLLARSYLPTYLALFAGAAALLVLQSVLTPSLVLALALTGAAALAVVWTTRGALQIDAMFPELTRWPLMRALVQPSRSA
jgi:O-antigen/teichoic acid export membrane protein